MYIIYVYLYDYCGACAGQENYIPFAVHFRKMSHISALPPCTVSHYLFKCVPMLFSIYKRVPNNVHRPNTLLLLFSRLPSWKFPLQKNVDYNNHCEYLKTAERGSVYVNRRLTVIPSVLVERLI